MMALVLGIMTLIIGLMFLIIGGIIVAISLKLTGRDEGEWRLDRVLP